MEHEIKTVEFNEYFTKGEVFIPFQRLVVSHCGKYLELNAILEFKKKNVNISIHFLGGANCSLPLTIF